MRKVSAEDITSAVQWKPSMPFPKDNYAIRCIGETCAPSKAGNPMVTLEWEIVNASPKEVKGKMVEFDGVQFTTYHTTRVIYAKDKTPEEIAKSSQKAFDDYGAILRKAGYDITDGYDDQNPPAMKGKVMYVCVRAELKVEYKEPTLAQREAGQPGYVLKDGNGNDRITYWPKVAYADDWYGVYAEEVRPF